MQQQKKNNGTFAIVGFVLFSISTFLVVENYSWFNRLDSLIYQLSWTPNATLTYVVNVFAKTATIVPIFIVSLGISVVLWLHKKRLLAFWNLSNVLIVSFLGFVLKHLISRPRPSVNQLVEKTSFSFPSGHSLLAMCLVCSTFIVLQQLHKNYKPLKIGLIVYLLLIAMSRIFLRVHYPSDILGGFLLSFTWVNFSYAILKKTYMDRKFPSRSAKRSFIKKMVFCTLLLFAVGASAVTAYGIKVFTSVQKTAGAMYQPLERKSTPVDSKSSEPISILLLGIANDSKRKTDFRANTIMVATLNNDKESITLTSIPRDAYVEIVGKNGIYDKINHAHSYGGEKMIIDTVENYTKIPINHYFSINMDGLSELAEAVGGVTVNNDFEFDAEGIHYPKGKQHLNGWETLQYARMRYEDPDGDYGRQKRQREVTTLLMKEMLSIKSVFRYQELLNVIGNNGQTDMTLDQMITILKNYQKAFKKIDSDQVRGENFTGDGYTGELGISYQVIPDKEKIRVQKALAKQLNITWEAEDEQTSSTTPANSEPVSGDIYSNEEATPAVDYVEPVVDDYQYGY